MTGIKHVHRHFKHLDELLYMYNITFLVADDGCIDITDLTLHPIIDGMVDHTIIPENAPLTAVAKLNVLKMLYDDGLLTATD